VGVGEDEFVRRVVIDEGMGMKVGRSADISSAARELLICSKCVYSLGRENKYTPQLTVSLSTSLPVGFST